jgi:hypothetical protein
MVNVFAVPSEQSLPRIILRFFANRNFCSLFCRVSRDIGDEYHRVRPSGFCEANDRAG